MNKFSGPEDRGFLAVSAEISKMCTIEEPLFKQAVNYLRDKCYSESKLKIIRLSGAILSIDQCYINLVIVENVRTYKASKNATERSSPFSFLARQKVETPNESLQVSLADIFNSRGDSDAPGNPPRRILIRGRAGVGKTTLCKKIIHDFNQSRLWEGLFDCILWVPLRNLKGRKGSGYNFEKLLFDEFFASSGNELGQRFSKEMGTTRPQKNILFVLDGWDEVAQLAETDQDMFVFLEELLGLPNIIITSRPSASLPPGVNVHLELETIGFYPEQVNEYIINNNTQYADEIELFLQSHQLVQSLARIPIQLDAICHCWRDIKAKYGDLKPQTMTSLYQAIHTSLWKKDVPRLKLKREDGELIQPSDIRHADEPRIEDLVQRHLFFLEHLAFDGLINDVIEFELKHLNPVNNDKDHCLLLDSLLPHLSFLRTSNPSTQFSDQSYHFIHFTFQEYFAARYFARSWSRDCDLKSLMFKPQKNFRPAEFLARYKYDQRFNVMWRFVAGLLDIVDDKEEHHPATCFLKEIEEEPRDLLGPAHQRLVMHCLSEVTSSGGLGFVAYKERLEENLARWLCIECETSNFSFLAVEPEFPEKSLEKGLKQGSEKTREAIKNALVRRRAPHAALNAAFACLDDNSLSKDMKNKIFYQLRQLNNRSTKYYIRQVVSQSDLHQYGLRAIAWSILISQPMISREVIQLIMAKFKEEDITLRIKTFTLLARNLTFTKEVIRLVTAQLEDLNLPQNVLQLVAAQLEALILPQDVHQLAAAQVQNQIPDVIERVISSDSSDSSEAENPSTRNDSRLREIEFQILRKYFASSSEIYHDRKTSLQFNENISDEMLQTLPDLSKEALLSVAEQLHANDVKTKHWALKILGNRSDLSKEILLLVVEQLRDYHLMGALQVLRGQSDLSKEVLHAVAEIFILQPHEGKKLEEIIELLENQPALPAEILCLIEGWQDDMDQSRKIEALCIPEGQLSLSKDTLLLVVSKLRSNGARTREAAVKCLKSQVTISEDVLYSIAEHLKDTDDEIIQAALAVLECQVALPGKILPIVVEQLTHPSPTINWGAARVLECQIALSDEMLQSIIKYLKHESYTTRAATAKVFSSRTDLSQELLELIANQLLDQTSEIKRSGFEIFTTRETSILPKQIIQLVEAQLEDGTANIFTLNSIFEILAGQSALSKNTLQLVARQLETTNRYERLTVAKFLKQQSILPVEALEVLGELISDDIYRLNGQEEAAELLKGQPCLPETVLRLVEKPLCATKRTNARTLDRALEILEAQSVLSEERLQLIMNFRRRGQGMVEALFGQPYLYNGVLETHLFPFYETLLEMSFCEHLVWISQDSGSYFVKDSRLITWNNPVSSKKESELVTEVQKSLYELWELPEKGFPWTALWHSY
jgi:hypothetical protein